MSKLAGTGKIVFGLIKCAGAISTVTGHGVINMAAAALRVRVPHGPMMQYCKHQFNSGVKLIQDGMSNI